MQLRKAWEITVACVDCKQERKIEVDSQLMAEAATQSLCAECWNREIDEKNNCDA